MNRSLIRVLGLVIATSSASGQVNQWVNPGGGQWSTPADWSLAHTPLPDEDVWIGDGTTVTYSTGVSPVLNDIFVSRVEAPFGTLQVTGGTLNIGADNTMFVGLDAIGNLLVGAGAVLNTGALVLGDVGGEGYFLNVGGDLVVQDTLLVGGGGNGSFIQIDGSISADVFNAGLFAPADVQFLGGTMDIATTIAFGANAPSTVLIDGAVITGDLVGVAGQASGTTQVQLASGTLQCTTLIIGDPDSAGGSFTQTGGLVDTLGLIYGAGLGTTIYNLQGGVLDTSQVALGTAPTQFNMSGGVFRFNDMGTNSVPFDLAPTGGTVAPGNHGEVTGATMWGDLSLPLGVTLELDLQAPGSSDSIELHNGLLVLGGTLQAALLSPPTDGDVFTLIDNDGVDPVSGTFDGLPEGSVLDLPVSGYPVAFGFTVSYQGGDGNDVTLTYDGCPMDFTNDGVLDNGDIGAYLSAFLSGDMAADMTGDGFLDNGDIGAFILGFLVGC